MRLNFGGNKHTLLTNLDSDSRVLGLEQYLQSLERSYFSNITLRKYNTRKNTLNIALDMVCPITLVEMLGHFAKGRWGHDANGNPAFEKSFKAFAAENQMHLDIEELTLFLTDTSIVIKRIYDYSVPEQLHNIFTEIASHYVFLTKGLTERPYEIFVPVFEESILGPDCLEKSKTEGFTQNYFEYWGIYMDSEDDAMIYDLKKHSFIPADLDLYMLED